MRTGWTLNKLGDLADVISGYAFRSQDFQASGVPVIKISNIRIGDVELMGAQCVSPEFLSLGEKYHVRGGDILISLTGSHITQPNSVVGRVALLRDASVHGLLYQLAGKIIIRNNNVTDSQFLFYVLRDPKRMREIATMAHGAASQANVSPRQVESLNVYIPPVAVQRKIGNILSAYDDLIENNTRRIKILEQMTQMLYREWFVNFRFPGHEKVKMADTPFGKIPDSWKMAALDCLCKRITDGSHWSPTSVEVGCPMASSKDMHRWGLDLSRCRKISEEDYESLVRNDCRPLAGDVLITKDGANYLKYCFAVERDMDVVLLSSVAMLRPDPSQLSSHYLSFSLTNPETKARLSGRVSGVAIPRIVLKDFREFKIAVPSRDIQMEFDRVIEPLVLLCRRLVRANENLRTTRDLLLPKLVSGEIEIPVAEDLLEGATV